MSDEISNIPQESADELFDNAPCGYLSLLDDGRIARVNQTFLDWTGHDRASLIGKPFRDLLTIPGKIYFETHWDPLLQMQQSLNEVAFDMARPGRPPLPVLVNATRRPAPDGRRSITRITVVDVTYRRQYERELLAARQKAERAVETERAARELSERANRVKDEFLAQVSHELRTPLNAILGWVQVLGHDAVGNADLQDGLSIIERNTRVQVQLVEDLLDVGRIATGKMRLDVQRVELAGVVEAAIETSKPAAEAKGLRLQKVLDPTVIVAGDPGRLQQVFWNLLANAMKFTPKGGFVRVVMERVNSHIEVSVTDSGVGMKPEFIARAFEQFSQSDTARTQKTTGLGLGLSIVKHLVEMHGGTVTASSPGEGRGSTFIVHLPVVVVEPAGADVAERVHPRPAITDAPVRVDAISLAGVRVLVVDDEEDARNVVRRVLARANAEVSVAGSAAEALQVIEQFAPHVMVSDVGMPGVDGYELIRRVRLLGTNVGNTKAVALTAYSRLEDRTRAMLAGFQMHLVKPIEPSELVVTVASLAGRI